MIESTVRVNNSSIGKSWLDRFHSPARLVKISLHTRARSIEIGTIVAIPFPHDDRKFNLRDSI